jgi:hypothetical protein
MKKILVFLGLVPLLTSVSFAQAFVDFGENVLLREPINGGIPNSQTFPVFDLSEINSDNFLDMANTQNFLDSAYVDYRYNNQSGSLGIYMNFLAQISPSSSAINDVAFGLLRPSQSKKDLAVARENELRIHRNNGGMIESNPVQTISSLTAKSISWGAFNSLDGFEDLAVSTGTSVRIYINAADGTVFPTPLIFNSISAPKIVLAQMNQRTYDPTNPNDRWDLVSVNANTISIRLNNNLDGFGSQQDVPVTQFGSDAIYDLSVGDVNNDGYNDVVVT